MNMPISVIPQKLQWTGVNHFIVDNDFIVDMSVLTQLDCPPREARLLEIAW